MVRGLMSRFYRVFDKSIWSDVICWGPACIQVDLTSKKSNIVHCPWVPATVLAFPDTSSCGWCFRAPMVLSTQETCIHRTNDRIWSTYVYVIWRSWGNEDPPFSQDIHTDPQDQRDMWWVWLARFWTPYTSHCLWWTHLICSGINSRVTRLLYGLPSEKQKGIFILLEIIIAAWLFFCQYR